MNQTGLTWGNLSAHLSKLEEGGYIEVEKTFKGKRPNTLLQLTPQGREAFQSYVEKMKQVFNDLPT
jgi:DNA-binding MarR family transcriptional regulator